MWSDDSQNDIQVKYRTFTGQEQDGTGLMYFRARYMDPALGTFVSPDTMVPEPSVVFDYNRYMYVRGNNLKYNDPSGHFLNLASGLAGAAIGGVIGGGFEYYKQIRTNVESTGSLQWSSFSDNIDVGRVAGAASRGAIVGGAFGALGPGGVAIVGASGMAAVGATASVAAGQVEPLVTSSVNGAVDYFKEGKNVTFGTILQQAQHNGFGDPNQMVGDYVGGALGGVTAFGVGSMASSLSKTLSNASIANISVPTGFSIAANPSRTNFLEVPSTVVTGSSTSQALASLAQKTGDVGAKQAYTRMSSLINGFAEKYQPR